MPRDCLHLVSRNGLTWVQSTAFSRLTWLVHGFSTRLAPDDGGSRVGRAPVDFSMGLTPGAPTRKVAANRRRFADALNPALEVASLRQIHSATVYEAVRADGAVKALGSRAHAYRRAGWAEPFLQRRRATKALYPGHDSHSLSPGDEHLPEGDALMTSDPRILLSIRTADCLPALLVDRRLRVIAAIHAGWRGALARIVEVTVGDMCRAFSSRPEDLRAALGPSIGRCCYQVGDDVVDAFRGQFRESETFFHKPPAEPRRSDLRGESLFHRESSNFNLDLAAVARAQLVAAGLKNSAIHGSNYCTACQGDLFFSYRREGARAGRMMNAIGVRV